MGSPAVLIREPSVPQEGEPVDRLLGTDFLKNADKRIGGGDDKEKAGWNKTLPRSGRRPI